MSTHGWTEDGVHVWLAGQAFPAHLRGSRGHDAAVLQAIDGTPVLCSDQCVEGVHFTAGTPPRAVGRKAVLRTLSDLAATACAPVAVTVNVRAPAEYARGAIQELLLGAAEAAQEYRAELVAGDLAMAKGPMGLSVTAMGSFPEGLEPVGRDRARPGQTLGVSGPLGGSFESGRHLEPRPRFDAALAAYDGGARAMMDVSDGLAWDLYRLGRAASVKVELDLASLPIHGDVPRSLPAAERTRRALHDGEDHELLATWPAESPTPSGWTVIGRTHEGSGLVMGSGDDVREWDPAQAGGWRHDGNGAHG